MIISISFRPVMMKQWHRMMMYHLYIVLLFFFLFFFLEFVLLFLDHDYILDVCKMVSDL